MSSIAEGIEFVLAQSRAERDQQKTAEIAPTQAHEEIDAPGNVGAALRKVAHSNLAAADEDVTVGDLQALMREFQ